MLCRFSSHPEGDVFGSRASSAHRIKNVENETGEAGIPRSVGRRYI